MQNGEREEVTAMSGSTAFGVLPEDDGIICLL